MNIASKSRSIVLHRMKYRETSLLVTLFTENIGKVSVVVKGCFDRKSKLKANMFQPLFLLETELNISPKRNLHWIKEARTYPDLIGIASNPTKQSIILLLEEVLYKTINEETSIELFDFVWNSIQILDKLPPMATANFHLSFLLKYTRYLGILPTDDYSTDNQWFDIITGHFTSFPSTINIKPEYTKLWHEFLSTPITSIGDIKLNVETRNILLDHIFSFYQQHLPQFKTPKSLQVLRSMNSPSSLLPLRG